MKPNEIVTLILSIVTAVLIPLVVVLVRGATKWTRVEAKLDHAVDQLKKIVEDKDKTHHEIYDQLTRNTQEVYAQMREDRVATDRRLRWLEEFLWKRGNNNRDAA